MKNNFFQKNKQLLSIVAAILAFAAITLVYFSPVLQGKRVKQHDMEMHKGMAQELTQYREATGETALWTNSAFGGMPAWNITAPQKTNLFDYVHKVLSIGLPSPYGSVFISMLGFFILLLVLDVGVWTSFLGAIAYGLTSYLFIVIGAGHNAKAVAMAYMPPVIAGILLTYKGKYLWGSLLTAIALALEIRANHLQITYYLLLIIVILVIAEFISDLRKKQLLHFAKASVLLVAVAVISTLTFATKLYANYEYGKETSRGKPVLTQDTENQTKGLERDYITQWSYGIGETWSLLIPNAKGGASAYIGKQNRALDKADRQFRDNIAQSNAYWGDQPMTSGPVYVGAIVIFLFILGALTVKGNLKWALLAATLLSILLSWGKNFMGFTNFFLDYIPGYDKFRAVSMTLVMAEVCMPLLAFLGLAEIVKSPDAFQKNIKKFYIALGITAGICLLFYIAPKTFFSFLSQEEASQFAAMGKGKDGAIYAAFATQLENVRVAIFRKDALRSLLFILLAAVPVFLYGKGKLKSAPAFAILAALILIDMFTIDKRYLNNDNFILKQQFDKPFTATAADQYILADKDLDFRVVDLTKSVFNDASTSYFHKSIGGYSGAKLRRYQDVISGYLGKEIQQFSSIFKSVNSNGDLVSRMEQQKVLNMLNTKYVIYDGKAQPLLNPCAYGNAWLADDIKFVGSANEEFDAIADTDLRHTAIVNKEFESQVGNYHPTNSEGSITLTDYKPNQVTYSFSANEDKLAVFSEIWTSRGWTMRIDGQEQPLLRANYLLRAAMVPAGQHEIVMRYEPKIWKVGGLISLVSSSLILLAFVGAAIYFIAYKKKSQA
ncbi:MAG: YfhO family protein [Bacteroidales bacterium]|nr:YfhO family protein [Bacteroidales bacterium]